MTELRDYQHDAVNAIKNNNIGLIEAATGSGKTTIMSHSILQQEGNVLILVHTIALVEQTKKRIAEETGYKVSAFYGEEKESIGAHVVVSTWQSMANILHVVSPRAFNHIHVDEAHNVRSPAYQAVVKFFRPKTLHGYTATLEGNGKKDILDVFEKVIYSIGMFELIDLGYLAKMQILVSTSDKPGIKNQKNYNQKKYDLVRKMTDENANTVKSLHFYNLNKRFNQITDWNLLKSDSYAFIEGSVKKNDRERYFKDFIKEDSGLNHLVANRILNEGIDLPITNSLIFHESVGDVRTITQRFGRGLRVWEGNKDQKTLIMFFVDSENINQMKQINDFIYDIKEEAKNSGISIVRNTNSRTVKEDSEPTEELPVTISFVDVTEDVFNQMSNNVPFATEEEHIKMAVDNNTTPTTWVKHFNGNYVIDGKKYYCDPVLKFHDFWNKAKGIDRDATEEEHIKMAIDNNIKSNTWNKHFNGNYVIDGKKYYSAPIALFENFWDKVKGIDRDATEEEHIKMAIDNNINSITWTKHFNGNYVIDGKKYYCDPKALLENFWDKVKEIDRDATEEEHIKMAIDNNIKSRTWVKHFNGNYVIDGKKYYSNPVSRFHDFWNKVKELRKNTIK